MNFGVDNSYSIRLKWGQTFGNGISLLLLVYGMKQLNTHI